jgi:hypothetical protein
MNKQLIKRMLKEYSAREDLTELVNIKVSDVKHKNFKKNSQNNYRLEYRVKGQISSVIFKRNYPKKKTASPPNPFNPITQTVGRKSQQKEMCI